MTACIVGWSHLPFGKHEGRSAESRSSRRPPGPSPTAASGLGEGTRHPAAIDEREALGAVSMGFLRRERA